MQRYQLRYPKPDDETLTTDCLDVPDITTALVVAEIVAESGTAEIWDGERRLAAISRRSAGLHALWHID